MIRVSDLRRYFGQIAAVDGISFEVDQGEVLGFLGPNGAGKTTTMRMLTGFLRPSSGTVEIEGTNIEKAPIACKTRIGYLPEGAPAYEDMRVCVFLNFIAQVRKLDGEDRKRAIGQVVDQLELTDVLKQPIRTLSKGFKRRVGLAQALIHDPKVLILDEPTDGLDPNQKHHVRSLIKNLAEDKVIIVSTHILEEVHAVCSRALIIADGKIVADGSSELLCSLSDYHNAIRLQFARALNDAEQARLSTLAGVQRLERDESGQLFTLVAARGKRIFPQVNQLLKATDWPVDSFSVETGRLDDVFRKLTAKHAVPAVPGGEA